jgi:hypothetical protein
VDLTLNVVERKTGGFSAGGGLSARGVMEVGGCVRERGSNRIEARRAASPPVEGCRRGV